MFWEQLTTSCIDVTKIKRNLVASSRFTKTFQSLHAIPRQSIIREMVYKQLKMNANSRKAKNGKVVDVRKPKTFIKAGYIPEHETAIIIHGFNGTQTSQHIMYLKEGDL